MSFGRFIISKTFFINLGIIFGFTLVLIFIIAKSLDSYTGRGEYILVPPLQAMNGDSLVLNSDENFLQYVIIDSIFDSKSIPGTVSQQYPTVGAKVKKGRKIYLTIITKGREYIPMPNLVDLSIRRAIDVINQSRLTVNQLIFVENFARNAVLAQLIRQDTIAADSMVLIGTPINLVVGNGHNSGGVFIPLLIGKTAEEAKELILKSSLNFGGADTSGSSRTDLKVYGQFPAYNSKAAVFLGDAMYISLRSAIGLDFDSLLYQIMQDKLTMDTLAKEENLLNTDLDQF